MRDSAIATIAMVLISVPAAFADDPLSVARAHDAAFDQAALACDVPTMLTFYEDRAEAIYPGEEEVATDKAGIEQLVRHFISPWCSQGQAKPILKEISFHALPLGTDYIMIVRLVDVATTEGTLHTRATELLHQSGGKWRYLVDHASSGMPAPAAAPTPH